MSLISIEDVDSAFYIISCVEYFRLRGFGCLDQSIDCHRFFVILDNLIKHLVEYYIFWEDSFRPIEHCFVLLVNICMGRVGGRVKRNVVGEVRSKELKAEGDLLTFGRIDKNLIPRPEAGLDDSLIAWLKVDKLKFLGAGDIISKLVSERSGDYFVSLGFAGH